MNGATRVILWGMVAVYAVLTVIDTIWSGSVPVPVLVLFLVAFVLPHGALRYGWRGILSFIAIALVVSNILENVSILTGFPFGHYYYTGALGPKLFLVPLLIGPAYIGTGYLAWVIGCVLIGDMRRGSPAFTLVAVPVIASFAMVVWDLCFDPTLSTMLKFWIWEQGGGYFGVPLTNYLGWYLTVYLFYQIFALFIHFGLLGRVPASPPAPSRTYYLQAVTAYATIGLSYVLSYLTATGHTVTDGAGVSWGTAAIHETSAIIGLFTMVFIALLSAIKLYQPVEAPSAAPSISVADVNRAPVAAEPAP